MAIVNGEVRPDVRVSSVQSTGRTGERLAELSISRTASGWAAGQRQRIDALAWQQVVVLQPVALGVGENRVCVLFSGRFEHATYRVEGRSDRVGLSAVCDWSRQLDTPLEPVSAILTLGDALKALARAVGGFDAALLELDAMSHPVRFGRGEAPTAGDLLRMLVDRFGLIVRTHHVWDGRGVRTRVSIRSSRHGRIVWVQVPAVGNVIGERQVNESARAIKLSGQASAQVVESTFELVPGWDLSGEGEADNEYSKSISTDFDCVASVYRLWVLNEDGAFGAPVFDLSSLFDEGRPIVPQPLRFDPALALDATGQSVGVVVEYTVNDGISWHRYPGVVINRRERAAVYFDDDTLPADLFDAAKAGTARVRVTASLTSPLPTECVRWAGNPFVGEPVVSHHDFGDRFQFRRVDQSSKYAEEIASGQRASDACDDRLELEQWVARLSQIAGANGSAMQVDLSGLVIGLRVGDRLAVDVGEPRMALRKIELDWEQDRTRVWIERVGGRL